MNGRGEQHVIDVLQDSLRSTPVTEQDLITAHGRLEERLRPPSRRRRGLVLAAVAVAVLVVGVVGLGALDPDAHPPSPARTPASAAETLAGALEPNPYVMPAELFTAGTAPTLPDLAGFWVLRPPHDFTMMVDVNGRWKMGGSSDWLGHGTSALTGATWTRRLADDSRCARTYDLVGFSQRWRAALAEDGSLRLLFTGDRNICTPADDREVWDRVAPGSALAAYLDTMALAADWQPVADTFAWEGLYVAPRSGDVLEVGADGHYRYYDGGSRTRLVAADRGILESSAGTMSGSCTGGRLAGSLEIGATRAVSGLVHPYRAIRLVPTTDGCASGIGKEGVWVDVSPAA